MCDGPIWPTLAQSRLNGGSYVLESAVEERLWLFLVLQGVGDVNHHSQPTAAARAQGAEFESVVIVLPHRS